MQETTGSLGNEKRALTPFEQAEYDLLNFANSVSFSMSINEAIDRIEKLERLDSLNSREREGESDDQRIKRETRAKAIKTEKEIADLTLSMILQTTTNLIPEG